MKTNLILAGLVLVAVLAGCRAAKNEVVPVIGSTTTPTSTTTGGTTTNPVSLTNPAITFNPTGQTLLGQGAFMNGVHNTSGTAKLYNNAGKRTLVLEKLTVDAGPDLRIYIAEDKALTNAIEITKLTATGSFFVELPANYDPAKQRTVLIWCKAYSVLFGSATVN